jgi:hypothetical protein
MLFFPQMGTAFVVANVIEDHLSRSGVQLAQQRLPQTLPTTAAAAPSEKKGQKKTNSAQREGFFHITKEADDEFGLRVVGLTAVGKAALDAEPDVASKVRLYFEALETFGSPKLHSIIFRVFLLVGPVALFKPPIFAARMLLIFAEVLGAGELLELARTGQTCCGLTFAAVVEHIASTAQMSVRSNDIQFSASKKNIVLKALANEDFCAGLGKYVRQFEALKDKSIDDLFEVVQDDQVRFLVPKQRFEVALNALARRIGFLVAKVVGNDKVLSMSVLLATPFAIDCSRMSVEDYVRVAGDERIANSGRLIAVLPPAKEAACKAAPGAELIGLECFARYMAVRSTAASEGASASKKNKHSYASHVAPSPTRPLTLAYMQTVAKYFEKLVSSLKYAAFDVVANQELIGYELRLDALRAAPTIPDSFKKEHAKQGQKRKAPTDADNNFVDLFGGDEDQEAIAFANQAAQIQMQKSARTGTAERDEDGGNAGHSDTHH